MKNGIIESYEDLEKIKEIKCLKQENQHLKDLLKECRDVIKDVDTYCTINADEGYILIYRIDQAIGEKK